jgi:hypothetical protein
MRVYDSSISLSLLSVKKIDFISSWGSELSAMDPCAKRERLTNMNVIKIGNNLLMIFPPDKSMIG